MARRPHPVSPGSGARRAARMVLATAVVGLAVATVPLAAGAEEASATAPTLAAVLRGEVDGVTAEATTGADDLDMGIVVEVTNDGNDPLAVAIPFGTLVVTESEGDQTLAVAPPTTPDVIEAAADGGTPTIEVDPGTSTHELPVYCTELDDGYPSGAVAVSPIEPAHPVLAETLRTATATEADASTTQDAVWWLTDEPTLPVAGHLQGLLEVDTEAFAAAPHRVTPDTGYTPLWMREDVAIDGDGTFSTYDDEEAAAILDESFEGAGSSSSGSGGAGAAFGLWAVLVGLVVVTSVVIAARAGRRPTVAPALARTAPGWYPDPWGGGGHRYWDGRAWTTRTMTR